MFINELTKSKWLVRKSKRRGRGNASWRWNYSTRWLKWQWSRTGSGTRPAWFEGGQTPLNLRLPKLKGFKRQKNLIKDYQAVNLWRLEKDDKITNNMVIDKTVLKAFNYINKEDTLVKVLWTWDFSKAVTFTWMDAISDSAKQKIEKAGGKIN